MNKSACCFLQWRLWWLLALTILLELPPECPSVTWNVQTLNFKNPLAFDPLLSVPNTTSIPQNSLNPLILPPPLVTPNNYFSVQYHGNLNRSIQCTVQIICDDAALVSVNNVSSICSTRNTVMVDLSKEGVNDFLIVYYQAAGVKTLMFLPLSCSTDGIVQDGSVEVWEFDPFEVWRDNKSTTLRSEVFITNDWNIQKLSGNVSQSIIRVVTDPIRGLLLVKINGTVVVDYLHSRLDWNGTYSLQVYDKTRIELIIGCQDGSCNATVIDSQNRYFENVTEISIEEDHLESLVLLNSFNVTLRGVNLSIGNILLKDVAFLLIENVIIGNLSIDASFVEAKDCLLIGNLIINLNNKTYNETERVFVRSPCLNISTVSVNDSTLCYEVKNTRTTLSILFTSNSCNHSDHGFSIFQWPTWGSILFLCLCVLFALAVIFLLFAYFNRYCRKKILPYSNRAFFQMKQKGTLAPPDPNL